MVPKMLVGAYQRHLAMTPADAKFGVAVFQEPRINPQAHEYRRRFHPCVFKGIISTGKAVSEIIYRLVHERYLDWIFSCINRGKIIIW